jgi:hypothetical protein
MRPATVIVLGVLLLIIMGAAFWQIVVLGGT